MSNFPKPAFTIFDHPKLAIYADRREGKQKSASLKYVVHNNNPRFRYYTNDGSGQGALAIPLDPYIAENFFIDLEEVIANKEPDRITRDIRASWKNGQKLDKPESIARLHVGRNDKGLIYIALKFGEMVPDVFTFGPAYFGIPYSATGDKEDAIKTSEKAAKSYLRVLRNLTYVHMVVNAKDMRKGGNQGGNNYNKGGNGGGGYNNNQQNASKSAEDFGDDIPF